MRFANPIVKLACAAVLSLPLVAAAQDSKPYSNYISLTNTKAEPPRQQRGRQVQNLVSGPALRHNILARRLGVISAIDGKDGTLFVADKQSGQIFRLTDRDGNGQPDGTRPMPHRFDAPTGLAAAADALYVADRNAVWRVGPSGTPTLLAGLTNAKTTGVHFLRKGSSPDHLWIGLNTEDGQAKLLKLSTVTGQAELIEETNGRLLDMSQVAGARPWVLLERDGRTWLGPAFSLLSPMGEEISAFSLPLEAHSKQWPVSLAQHITAARRHSGDVLAVPIIIAKPVPMGRPILSGFTSRSGRQQWGMPGPLYQDHRGLIIADQLNGDLWRVSAKPPTPKPTTREAENVITVEELADDTKPAKPITPFGSSLTQGSTIGRASTLERASTLRSREEIAAEKEAKEKAAKREGEKD